MYTYTKTPINLFHIIITLLLATQVTQANMPYDKKVYTTPQKDLNLDLRISLGLLTGEANEYVYHPEAQHTASQLIWNIDSQTMLGLGASLHLTPNFIINTDFFFSVEDGKSKLTNYDWQLLGEDWTDRSIHNSTDITNAYMIDVNAEYITYKDPSISLSLLAGYKEDSFQWKAYGGEYIYSNEFFRDTTGNFIDSQLGISYEQIWSAAYFGLKMKSNFGKLNFNTKVIYSPLAKATATDNHYLRYLRVVDSFKKDTLFGIDLGIGYAYNEHLHISADYRYQKYDTVTGDSQWNDNGTIYYLDGYAGADLKTSSFFLKFQYTF
ncbi:MAG: Outer membrane protease [uncultured Sulfurovum sp.]|uniref:Outer membrane protease n=1 Tax=uncultured Sulfurovum sp. TaxID=269237 RepID=A0A6S6TR33_9BACT|nr:MAG: Outer membrane protease [uncultured Sulfurovum sp.]